MDERVPTALIAFAGMFLVLAAILWFVSPGARSRLRRWRGRALIALLLLLAFVYFYKEGRN